MVPAIWGYEKWSQPSHAIKTGSVLRVSDPFHGRLHALPCRGARGDLWTIMIAGCFDMIVRLGAVPENLQPSPQSIVTKGTDLLTRQNETRHRTGWTEDQRVSAGKWQCPRINRKEKLDPLPALHPGVWEVLLQWGFGQGWVCDSSVESKGGV